MKTDNKMQEDQNDVNVSKTVPLEACNNFAISLNKIKSNEKNVPCISEYKIHKPPSMEAQIRKLRIAMENWKPIILHLNSILMWEKQWHSTAIAVATTVVFMLLWLCEANILTVICLMGLIITILDYSVPSLSSSVFKNEISEEKQREYDHICTNIIFYKTKLELLFTSYYRMRVTNPKLYFSITTFALCTFAYIGSVINNLFLTYLLVTFILLAPGLNQHGMLDKWTGGISNLLNELIENAKSRVAQNKKIQ